MSQLRKCCRRRANLEEVESRESPDGRLVKERCRECGRRHFTMHANPKKVGVRAQEAEG